MSLKRKRGSSVNYPIVIADGPRVTYKKRKTAGRRAFVPGVDRTGGYYGRFSGRNAELKFHDVDLDDAVVATGGAVTATINIIGQGVTESTRVGRKCTIKSINWRYQVSLPTQTNVDPAATGDTLRVILYHDKQCNGGAATVLGLLETADSQSFRNLANSQRFNILCDKLHNINYAGIGADAANQLHQSFVISNKTWYKKCNIPIEFDNSADDGSLATIRTNNLGVLLISTNGICGMSGSKLRLRFSDS